MKNLLILIMPTVLMFAIVACEGIGDRDILRGPIDDVKSSFMFSDCDYAENTCPFCCESAEM